MDERTSKQHAQRTVRLPLLLPISATLHGGLSQRPWDGSGGCDFIVRILPHVMRLSTQEMNHTRSSF